MMRSLVQRAALVCGVMLGVIGTAPKSANAQKALVYCPVSVDATGCNAIVSALTGPAYPLGVDRGYDGTGGTVDLKAVDLFTYSVFVVPSLADGSTSQPYAMLRDPEVVEHLKAALIGRIAMWSGSPDQGATNRAMKDALIQNLAGWAGGAFGAAKGPGLVALLDASSNPITRYDWVRAIAPVAVTSDGALQLYNSVRALDARATTILTSGAGPIVYDNMATFGFQVPNGAAGVSLDAVGQTGTTQGGQVVLLTMEAGNASGATVKTDKDDYGPGETVTITGGGWQAGEEVKLSLHMDPLREADTELSATADGNGNITNADFSPATYDIGVRFVLTAVGQVSGRRAQATFTDGNKVAFALTAAGAEVNSFAAVTSGQCVSAFLQELQGGNPSTAPAGGRAVALSSSVGGATFYVGAGCVGSAVTTVTIPAGQGSQAFSFILTTAGAQTVTGNGGFTGNNNAVATITVNAPIATTLTLSAPSPASVTYGATGLVSVSATLTRTTGGTAVSGATVAFTIDAVTVGSATTNASGVATISYNPSTLDVASHTVASSFAGATLSGTTYTSATSGNQTLAVTQRTVTPNVTASSRIYDGTTAATILTRTLTGVLAGDVGNVTLTGGTASFDTKNIGTGKTVTATGLSITGTAAANYVLDPTTATTTANITAASVSVLITADGKVYDGTTTASILTRTLTGVIAGETVTVTGGTATFDTKDVGTGKTVTGTGFVLGGADAGNYIISPATAICTADISALGITGSFTASSRGYDGTTSATVLTRTLNGVIAPDVASLTGGTATFDDKNVGTGKTVTLTGASLAGADAGNYTLLSVGTTTANITALTITGSITASNKEYDGTTAATILTRTLAGQIAGDAVTYSGGSATFDTRNVGTGKTVTATGLSLTGGDAGNYTVNASAATTADITARALTGNITAASKVYDGNTSASILTRTLTGVLAGETVSYNGGTATFDTKNVGTNKTVTATALTLGGSDAGNYSVNGTATTTADVTALGITGSFTANDKVYDGNTSAIVNTRSLAGVIAPDAVTLDGGTATFDDRNVGTGKTVTLAGATLAGANAGNYSLTGVGTTTADITPLGITGSVTAANKVYDGNTSATILTRTLSGHVADDDVGYSGGTATFADKVVGTAKTVTATGLSLTGSDAGNYTVNSSATTAANITALAITGSITADNRIYDANTSATILTRTLTGVVAGDEVSYVGGTATFANKNVGTGKTVTGTGLSLNGADAGNYTVNATAGTTANITQFAIVGSITADNKVYDGTMAATILTRTLAGVFAGDVVSYTGGTATFVDKNVGVGKTVTGTGLGLTGGDAGNYSVNTTATTTASITQATPTIDWANPANIIWPEPLTSTQLNATVTGVASGEPTGSFAYTPAAATVLTPGVQSLAVVFTSTDPNYTNANKSVSITVLDQSKPIVTGTVVTPNPVALGAASVAVNGTISDLTTGGSKITSACYRIDGGATCTPVAAFTSAVTVNVTAIIPLPNVADVIEVCLYGTDASSNANAKMDCVLVAVFDPNGGFVTGGGWIDSPPGAYAASPTLTGKATFGFVSKYKKGQTTPDGSTEFQFQAAGFNFKSTSYEWLVVAGARAQYKGSGTINGSGDYYFMLTAIDMDLKGKPNADTFRFKVWNKNTLAVIYDNQIGLADTEDPTTKLGGGSIQLHDK